MQLDLKFELKYHPDLNIKSDDRMSLNDVMMSLNDKFMMFVLLQLFRALYFSICCTVNTISV